jgi:hypothetical protein
MRFKRTWSNHMGWLKLDPQSGSDSEWAFGARCYSGPVTASCVHDAFGARYSNSRYRYSRTITRLESSSKRRERYDV